MRIQFILSLILATAVSAGTAVPSIMADHMVLQQKQENPICGWDAAGTEIKISITGGEYETKTGMRCSFKISIR